MYSPFAPKINVSLAISLTFETEPIDSVVSIAGIDVKSSMNKPSVIIPLSPVHVGNLIAEATILVSLNMWTSQVH